MIHLRRYMIAMLLIALPCGAAVATFHLGDRGEDVRVVQTQLGVLGYHVDADGIYGQATAGAVRAFQEEHGLEADGLLGPITYRALIGRDIPVSRGDISTTLIRRLVSMAQQYVGVPYVYGGTTPNGFDCSGFVQFVACSSGLQVPRSADEQYRMGRRVASGELRPGDFVFFLMTDTAFRIPEFISDTVVLSVQPAVVVWRLTVYREIIGRIRTSVLAV